MSRERERERERQREREREQGRSQKSFGEILIASTLFFESGEYFVKSDLILSFDLVIS